MLFAALLAAGPLRAQQFWDGANTTANGAVDGGSGTWDNATANWTNATGTSNAAFTSGTAVFAGAAGTVTVGDNIQADELRFDGPAETIAVTGSLTMTISGAGITNNSGADQTFQLTGTADGYSFLIFSNHATAGSGTVFVNNPDSDPNDASFSGRTEFHDSASAGSATFVAKAAAVEGGGSGTIYFQDHATAANGVFTLTSSSVAGANGGFVIFTGATSAANSTVSVGGGTVDGAFGSYVYFGDTATAGAAIFTIGGGTTSGAEGGQVRFYNSADAGTAGFTFDGGEAGGQGSVIEFHDSSSAGSGTFVLGGGNTNGGDGASLALFDTATAGAGNFTFDGGTVDGANGSVASFQDSATLDHAKLTLRGGAVDGAGGSTAYFWDSATAANATITVEGGAAPNAGAGALVFGGSSSAGGSAITIGSGAAAGANPAYAVFTENSTAGSGQFAMAGAAFADDSGAFVDFRDSSSAGFAAFTTGGGTAAGANGGQVQFLNASSADHGTFDIGGGAASGALGSVVAFYGTTTAAEGVFTIEGGAAAGAQGGAIKFATGSTAADGDFAINGGATSGAQGGSVEFFDASTAANGVFAVHGEGAATAGGGAVSFLGGATAGHAIFAIDGGGADRSGNGLVAFYDASRAGFATFTVAGGSASGEYGGQVVFRQTASAADGTFTVNGGTVDGALWGAVEFHDQSTAGQGDFTVNGRGVNGARQGQVIFYDNSTAGDAHLTLYVGEATTQGSGGGTVYFEDNSTAGNATIVAKGGVPAGGGGAQVVFEGSSSAGNATLIAEDGVGQQGALIIFRGTSTGGSASVELDGTGRLLVGVPTLSIGSLRGTGGVLLGSNQLTFGGDNSSTAFSGTFFAGAGSLTKEGTGTFTLTGPALFTGATTISAGTLQIGDGGTSGSVAGDIVNNAALVVNRSDALTLPGKISGAGTLTKVGAGTLTLSGANTFTGLTSVNAGTLALANGSSVGAAQIAAGAALSGAGTVRGDLSNQGTVSLGASPGTLTVSGNYTQTAGGALTMQLASGTAFDHLAVSGTASLDGTLQIVALPGFAITEPGRFELVTAGSLAGHFASVMAPSFALPLALGLDETYDAHSFALVVTQKPFAGFAVTPNQAATAGGFDRAVAGGAATAIRDLFDTYTTAAPFASGLGQLSPQRFERWFDAAILGTGALVRAVEERTGTERKAAAQREAWAEVINRHATFDSDADIAGAKLEATGLIAGVDYTSAEGMVVGAALDYEQATLDLDGSGSRTRVKTMQPAIYARYAADAWQTDATLGYGRHDYESRRAVAIPGDAQIAQGDTKGSDSFASVRTSYQFKAGDLALAPFAGLHYVHWQADGFGETGAGDASLRLAEQRGESLASRLGVRLVRAFQAGTVTITPRVEAAWRHEFDQGRRDLTAAIGGSDFTVRSGLPAKDGWVATLGCDARVRGNFSVYAEVAGEGNTAANSATNLRAGANYEF